MLKVSLNVPNASQKSTLVGLKVIETPGREVTVQHHPLEPIIILKVPTTLITTIFSFSFSPNPYYNILLDENKDTNPLTILTLYNFYCQPNEVNKSYFAYILILSDASDFILVCSSSSNDRSP